MTIEQALQATEQIWWTIYSHSRAGKVKASNANLAQERIKAYDNLTAIRALITSRSSVEFKPDWANYAQGVKDGKAEVLLGCNEIDDKGVKP